MQKHGLGETKTKRLTDIFFFENDVIAGQY